MEIDPSFLKHLLCCLANQKFIHELLPEEREENQKIIDQAWNDGMSILHEKITIDSWQKWPES